MAEPTRKCRRCQKDFPFKDLKYFDDTVNLYCDNCIKEKKHANKSEEPAKVVDKEKRTKYKCYKCNYSFLQSKSYDRGCPYCGSKKVLVQEVTNNVDKLIAESSQSKYDQ